MRLAIAGIGALVAIAIVAIGAIFVVPNVLASIYEVPDQPFTFPHVTHAGIAELDCQFCHRNVDQTSAATVPAVEQCIFCHKIIVGGDGSSTGIVREAWETGQPITWTRVHRLPDTVRFWHEPHIRVLSGIMSDEEGRNVIASEVCETCHGDVTAAPDGVPANQVQVEQVRPLKMGDCIDCHRQNNAPTDCTTCHF